MLHKNKKPKEKQNLVCFHCGRKAVEEGGEWREFIEDNPAHLGRSEEQRKAFAERTKRKKEKASSKIEEDKELWFFCKESVIEIKARNKKANLRQKERNKDLKKRLNNIEDDFYNPQLNPKGKKKNEQKNYKKRLPRWIQNKKNEYLATAQGQGEKAAEQWWRFKLLPLAPAEINEIEAINIAEIDAQEKYNKLVEKIEWRRQPEGWLISLAFLFLIYFGWDKFWAWYESPLSKDWDFDENGEEDEEIKVEPQPEEKIPISPPAKTWWGKRKNWVLNNKMKSLIIIAMVGVLIWVIVWGWEVYKIVKK